MRYLALLSVLVALASAAVLQPPKVSYDGYKVFRLAVGDEVSKVDAIISKLNLKTWTGAPRAGAFADLVVPPSQIDAFINETVGMDIITMHEDLGASIANESSFQVYAGE
jgi:Carboxypeptidase activation peptide